MNKYNNYIFLDVWETLLISNESKKLNEDRAKIIYNITKFNNIIFWKEEIEKEINIFKINERNGISIKPLKRIENILFKNNISIEKSKEILDEFDSLIIQKYIPILNRNLLSELVNKNDNIILISNTGLTTKKCIIQLLENLKIKNIFKDMFFSEDYNYCKPNIQFFKIPMIKYKLNSKDIIMYGDSTKMDLEPCQKLGIECIIKNWRNFIDEY